MEHGVQLRAGDYNFSYGRGNDYHQLVKGKSVPLQARGAQRVQGS